MISIPKTQKFSNNKVIAIGGMIAAGKTTLSNDLASKINAKVNYELDENNKTQDVLLEDMYKREPDAGTVFQLYLFLKRHRQYVEASKSNQPIILDRTIFEDRLFAHENMLDDIISFSYYDRMWEEKVSEMINKVGLPNLYVILKIDWNTFKDRIFKRGRKSEIDNFSLNEEYFKNLNSIYVGYLENTCLKFGIPYIVLDANLPNEEKIKKILEKLNM